MRHKSPNHDRSKHQHWVPQFYLRYFATPESRDTKTPQVWIFSKQPEDGDEELTSVRNVCGKRYLYAPKQQDGSRSWALDDRLNDIEALLGQVWPTLATDFIDLGDQHIRMALSLFISIMHMRNPDNRRAVEDIHRELVDFYSTGPLSAEGTPLVESIEIKGQTHEFDPSDWHVYRDHGKDGHDRAFADMVQSETGLMAKHLLTKRWSILASSQDAFVTSDKPVVLSHKSKERYGYGTKDTVVTFPISPTRLLVMDDIHSEPSNQYYSQLPENVGAANMTAWHGALRFLITGRPVPEILFEFNELADAESDA